ncbi:hypothetical protein ASN18_0336 [Candidatus Magnetominusculus xianensis]|uniref:Uncharacterized protein n=1 Tax=Candidatus Magnetominusculus xianensis TaxID=1748249 RepID=A0ABR5SNF5_9BACT|nr:hypothetical protein ASN18_0336 [Candidatus Magnetominusculus xianensis]
MGEALHQKGFEADPVQGAADGFQMPQYPVVPLPIELDGGVQIFPQRLGRDGPETVPTPDHGQAWGDGEATGMVHHLLPGDLPRFGQERPCARAAGCGSQGATKQAKQSGLLQGRSGRRGGLGIFGGEQGQNDGSGVGGIAPHFQNGLAPIGGFRLVGHGFFWFRILFHAHGKTPEMRVSNFSRFDLFFPALSSVHPHRKTKDGDKASLLSPSFVVLATGRR